MMNMKTCGLVAIVALLAAVQVAAHQQTGLSPSLMSGMIAPAQGISFRVGAI